jgi:hypothetical protein
MLEHLEPILERLAQYVHPALYRGDEAAARAGLEQVQAELAAAGETPDAEALALFLQHLEFQVDEYFAGAGLEPDERSAARRQIVMRALEALAPAARTPAGQVLRARTLFEVACLADRAGLKELPTPEGDALAAQVPLVDRDNAFWSYLSTWAFDHRLTDQMFEAYTEYLVHRKPSLSRYNWERLRLMYLLTSGQAIFRDVEAVIDRLPNKVRADSFGQHIQPRCEEAGVWDERLQMMFELRQMDLGDRDQHPLPTGLDRRFRRHPWDETESAPPAAP